MDGQSGLLSLANPESMGKGDKLEVSGGPEVWPVTGGLTLLTARMQLLVRSSAPSIAAQTLKSAKNGRRF